MNNIRNEVYKIECLFEVSITSYKSISHYHTLDHLFAFYFFHIIALFLFIMSSKCVFLREGASDKKPITKNNKSYDLSIATSKEPQWP